LSRHIDIHKQRVPRALLLLDALGAVLVAVGVLDLVEAGPRLVPDALRFPGVGVVLVLAGVALMLPLPAWLVRRHRSRRT
jgi:hypothetical protein